MGNEWRWTKRYNPYNSMKLLAHVERWSRIHKYPHDIPPPVTVTVDPTNACNLNCQWCNAADLRSAKAINDDNLLRLAEFLGDWGVKAVCIAGGGEPTLVPPVLAKFIWALNAKRVRVGVVTNGTQLIGAMTQCDWVGISIDAGTRETYKALKGKDCFDQVIEDAKALIDQCGGDILGRPGLGTGVTYKFLACPENIQDIVLATQVAKNNGFKAIHIRPAGAPWFDRTREMFSQSDVHGFNQQIEHAQGYDDENFSVYAAQHKFDLNLEPTHNYNKCWAGFMTCVFMPSDKGVDVGLCCDRRGDKKMLLAEGMEDFSELKDKLWGGHKHWEIARSVNPCEDCPRCTYAPHNEIMEQVVVKDNMTHDFI